MGLQLKVGFLYFITIFSLGFVLGTLRVLFLIPQIGPLFAVLLELPIIVFASWWFIGVLLRRMKIDQNLSGRVLISISAFVLLIVAELTFSVLVFAQPIASFLDQYQTLPGVLGLLGQVAYGIFPLWRGRSLF